MNIEVEEKYKEALLKEGLEAILKKYLENINLIDYGAGLREVQHKVKETDWEAEANRWKELAEYYGRLLED